MTELYVGLMSGTSLDGVDAALVDFTQADATTPTGQLVGAHFIPFPDSIRAEALALQASGPDELERAARFAIELTTLYADATGELLARHGRNAGHISAVGCHGQTVRHRPEQGFTIQLCNPALLAERTGIRVVADFRSRDVAAGGQGAPLVPAFHAACFQHPSQHRVIVNIGGIANVTSLPVDGKVIGFDTGPGNLLLDGWIARHMGATFDRDGDWARSGTMIDTLLSTMLADPYFAAAPPKSTGRDYFHMVWLDRAAPQRFAPADVQATLLELTARTIADAITTFCSSAKEAFICGGGASNKHLLDRLQANLPALRIATTLDVGLDPDWVEAVAFAWLARQAIKGMPGNLPDVTGARGPRVLGAIYPA